MTPQEKIELCAKLGHLGGTKGFKYLARTTDTAKICGTNLFAWHNMARGTADAIYMRKNPNYDKAQFKCTERFVRAVVSQLFIDKLATEVYANLFAMMKGDDVGPGAKQLAYKIRVEFIIRFCKTYPDPSDVPLAVSDLVKDMNVNGTMANLLEINRDRLMGELEAKA